MKKIYDSKLCICLLLLLAIPFLGQAQVYVKADAAGTGDGSSWENAYTDLQTALDSIPEATSSMDVPEIWVAAGTYVTTDDATDSLAAFTMVKPAKIYGGFAGTESMLSERDVVNNVTQFSGDVSGNDVKDDFTSNKDDNTIHVLYIDSFVLETVVLDGITISGAHASNDPDVEFTLRTGGGVYAWAPVIVNDCTFTGNFARRAGSIYLNDRTSGSQITNTTFVSNGGGWRSAGVYAAGSNDLVVTNCDFLENQGIRGTLYLFRSNNATIENCNFIDNVNDVTFAGAYYNWNSIGTVMNNCTFRGNEAVNGGCMYVDGRETPENIQAFNNCTFEDNAASNSAGTIYAVTANMSLEGTTFTNNESGGFVGNMRLSTGGFTTVNNCVFDGNSGANGGGAIGLLFTGEAIVTNTTFDGNTAGWGAGIFCQSDSTLLTVDSCEFLKNTGDNIGGGAIFFTQGVIGNVTNSQFESNNATDGPGGAIYVTEDSLDYLTLDIDACSFFLNSAVGQGGALNVNNGEVTVTNSVFTFNLADVDDSTPTGRGGVLSNNASVYNNLNDLTEGKSVSDTSRVTFINNLFYENDGDLAGSIAQWEYQDDTLKANSYTILQNNVFMYSEDVIAPHYGIEAGAPIVISRGGNLTYAVDSDGDNIDTSLDEYLTHPKDLLNTNPNFADPANEDFSFDINSAVVDAGVAEGAPAFDINGFMRDDMPDIGPVELDQTISTKDLVDNRALTVAPNPTDAWTTLTLDNEWAGELQLYLVDAMGRMVKSERLQKLAGPTTFNLDVSTMAPGTYQILIASEKEVIVKSLVKL
ncbi:MAG: T9SS type A sorting domain-containing protein [Bacteroidota bacterium]